MTADTCPVNGCNLQGSPIPQEYRDAGHYGPNPATHYSRRIMIEVRGVYDGGLYYRCPDCDSAWPRFTALDTRLGRLSAQYVAARRDRQVVA